MTGKIKIVIDTNVLIDNPEILLNEDYECIIPYVVLHELDGLKKNVDLSYAVRTAIKIIYQQLKAGKVEISNLPTQYETPDEKIVKAAKKAEATLVSQDIGCLAVALARHVDILEDDNKVGIDGYLGYQEVDADLDYEEGCKHLKEMQVGEIEVMFDITLRPNEYVIVNRISNKTDIWKLEYDRVVRISQSMIPYKDADIMITPIDAYQMVAWDSVFSDIPLTVLEGKVGSSKTLSALVGLLARTNGQKRYKKFDKIYYTRAPIPVDRSLELGFMPGDAAEKSAQWIAGISSNLKFLYGNEAAESILSSHLEFVSLESIQGLSLQANEALLIDEYQLLSRDMLKQALSRVGQGGKVVLAGDPETQTYGINRSREGFKVLQKAFGQTDFVSYVQLNKIYRSEFVEFVDDLFKGV